MEISLREHIIRIRIIEIAGRLEAFTVSKLRTEIDTLMQGESRLFVVDLSRLEFMDSAGMSALVSLLKKARVGGGDVMLVKPIDPAAYRILTLTRFDQVFHITETLEEALKQF